MLSRFTVVHCHLESIDQTGKVGVLVRRQQVKITKPKRLQLWTYTSFRRTCEHYGLEGEVQSTSNHNCVAFRNSITFRLFADQMYISDASLDDLYQSN